MICAIGRDAKRGRTLPHSALRRPNTRWKVVELRSQSSENKPIIFRRRPYTWPWSRSPSAFILESGRGMLSLADQDSGKLGRSESRMCGGLDLKQFALWLCVRKRQSDVDDRTFTSPAHLQTTLFEHFQHGAIAGQDFGYQSIETRPARDR